MGLVANHELPLSEMSGDLPVKAQCLPFRQIPHTTRLFADFLTHSPEVQPFYPRSVYFGEWFKAEHAGLRYDPERRQRVASILERQNRAWDASPKTFENLARLRAGASAALTGQQVGLFGGPAFSLYKALTAVKLADEATRGGVDCVPIFWLATTDHDLAEINHVSLPGMNAAPTKLTTSTHGLPEAPVSTVTFGPEIEAVVEEAIALLGDSDCSLVLRECYRMGEIMGSAFARLFTKLFADWGVILLDAADPELHQVAEPIYRAAIERAAELDDALLARGQALEKAGYHQQAKVTPSSTLLFTMHDGARTPIHRQTNGDSSVDFLVGREVIPQPELLRRIATAPHHFSANVLLRPVVQDYLLPTLAYTGGAAEVAYFAQVAVVYQALLGKITPVLPRFSATVVEAKLESLLERYRITLPDLFAGPEALRELLGQRTLPQDLQNAFDKANASLDSSLQGIRDALGRLDVTLVEAATKAGSKMTHQLTELRARAARAEVRQSEVLARHAELLGNTLFPNKTLQEREVGGMYFVARYGKELLHQLYDAIHTDCVDHQVVTLD
jgi:bacillithiol biosynthesis cysteine-adding enzyme BshC